MAYQLPVDSVCGTVDGTAREVLECRGAEVECCDPTGGGRRDGADGGVWVEAAEDGVLEGRHLPLDESSV